jgi:hypothetical protein
LTALENPHDPNRDLTERPFYLFSAPPRFYTAWVKTRIPHFGAYVSFHQLRTSRHMRSCRLRAITGPEQMQQRCCGMKLGASIFLGNKGAKLWSDRAHSQRPHLRRIRAL